MVDTEGFVLKPYVTAASLSDQEGLFGILDSSIELFPELKKIWGDGGYQVEMTILYCYHYGVCFEAVKRRDLRKFEVLPRRWVVERTFAWIGRNRRMSKDYEFRTTTSEALIYCAMFRLMLRRAIHEIGTL